MMRARAIGAALAATVLFSAVLGADYKDNFAKAKKALDSKSWSQAMTHLRAAIGEQAQESDRNVPISGFGYQEPYLPHYFLGVAHFGTGDCVSALTEWRTSERQGRVQKTRYAQTIQRSITICEGRLAANAPKTPASSAPPSGDTPASAVNAASLTAAIQQAEQAMAKAETAGRTVSTLASDSLLSPVWKQDARLDAAEGRAADLLATARTTLDEARKQSDPRRAGDAADAANRASESFETIRQLAETRRNELRVTAPRVEITRREPEGPGRSATSSAPQIPPPPPTGPRVPEDLLNAGRLFFNAQYRQASASLAQVRYQSGPEALQAWLFRAAAAYAEYVTEGETDTRLREQARQAVRECRRLNPAFSPDPTVFSPRFIEFYRAAR